MKIKYLGTAAAEGIPALFCECEKCRRARINKGKDIRSRSQVLINDDLLVDYPPDSYYHFVINDIDFSKIRNLVISHAHEDHFYPLDFEYFLSGFSIPKKCLPFTIYGSIDLKESLEPVLNNERNQGLRYVPMEAYKGYEVGNYVITPLAASHGTNNPFIHIISDGKKEFLYCHDTGPLKEEVYEYLNRNRHHFDLISIDCNEGNNITNWTNHMCLNQNIETIERLKKIGCVDDNTRIIVSHFSHNGGHVLYDDMVKAAGEHGFTVSYDGMEVEV